MPAVQMSSTFYYTCTTVMFKSVTIALFQLQMQLLLHVHYAGPTVYIYFYYVECILFIWDILYTIH